MRCPFQPPARMTPPAALIDDLVSANRILAGLAVLDGFGHVSARHPEHPDRYLLSRSLAPELVTRDDIMTFDQRFAVEKKAVYVRPPVNRPRPL